MKRIWVSNGSKRRRVPEKNAKHLLPGWFVEGSDFSIQNKEHLDDRLYASLFKNSRESHLVVYSSGLWELFSHEPLNIDRATVFKGSVDSLVTYLEKWERHKMSKEDIVFKAIHKLEKRIRSEAT